MAKGQEDIGAILSSVIGVILLVVIFGAIMDALAESGAPSTDIGIGFLIPLFIFAIIATIVAKIIE